MIDIILGRDALVAAWAKARHGMEFFPPSLAVGLAENGTLVGAIVFNNYTRSSIELSVAGETRAFTPRVVRWCFGYVFGQLGCARATLRTAKRKRRVRDLILRLGFRPEGKLRRYYGTDDAMMYGLLKDEAGRWLRPAHRKEQ
jgi:RimJ/RimL family protein N-acetyltransferase